MEIEIKRYLDSTNVDQHYKLQEIYKCLKRIEEILGYSTSAILSHPAEDFYWMVYNKEDQGHFTDDFINDLKQFIKSDNNSSELKTVIEYLANIISRRFVGSSFEQDLRDLLNK